MYESIKVETEPIRLKMEAKQREREPKAQALKKCRFKCRLTFHAATLWCRRRGYPARTCRLSVPI